MNISLPRTLNNIPEILGYANFTQWIILQGIHPIKQINAFCSYLVFRLTNGIVSVKRGPAISVRTHGTN
jgi:hypothetical protein